jgi:hypothetical protein
MFVPVPMIVATIHISTRFSSALGVKLIQEHYQFSAKRQNTPAAKLQLCRWCVLSFALNW